MATALKGATSRVITLGPGTAPCSSGSEDYSELVAAGTVRSVYCGIGGYVPGIIVDYRACNEQVPVNHSPYFLPDAAKAIPIGIRTLTLAALAVLEPTPAN